MQPMIQVQLADLRARLSEYLQEVDGGAALMIQRPGKRVLYLSAYAPAGNFQVYQDKLARGPRAAPEVPKKTRAPMVGQITGEHARRIGLALYGRQWQAPMARALGVARAVVAAWPRLSVRNAEDVGKGNGYIPRRWDVRVKELCQAAGLDWRTL